MQKPGVPDRKWIQRLHVKKCKSLKKQTGYELERNYETQVPHMICGFLFSVRTLGTLVCTFHFTSRSRKNVGLLDQICCVKTKVAQKSIFKFMFYRTAFEQCSH